MNVSGGKFRRAFFWIDVGQKRQFAKMWEVLDLGTLNRKRANNRQTYRIEIVDHFDARLFSIESTGHFSRYSHYFSTGNSKFDVDDWTLAGFESLKDSE